VLESGNAKSAVRGKQKLVCCIEFWTLDFAPTGRGLILEIKGLYVVSAIVQSLVERSAHTGNVRDVAAWPESKIQHPE
jgi:hypothetical protein